MAGEMRVYFTAYVARGRLFAAPLGTPMDAGPAHWVDCGPCPELLTTLVVAGDVYTAQRADAPAERTHTAAPKPGTIMDAQGTLLPPGQTSWAHWPLQAECDTCGKPVRADIDGGPAMIWLHLARCQHCEADIVQAAGGVWMDMDGMTACAKAERIGQLLVHTPMPQVT